MYRAMVLHCGLLALVLGTLSASPAEIAPPSPDKEVQKLKEQLANEMAQNARLRHRNDELEKELLDMGAQLKKLGAQLKAPPTNWVLPQLKMPRLLQDGRAVPPDWNERQFNGMPYYVIPLEVNGADQGRGGMQR